MNIDARHYKSPDGTKEFDAYFINGTAYINATSLYQKFDKTSSAFTKWKDNNLVPYAERLIELGKFQNFLNGSPADNQQVTLDDVIIIKKGGRAGKESVEQGTWFHPRLGIVFARWLDLDFELWCDEQIAELLMTGKVELRPEDQEWIDHATDVYEDCPDGGRRSMAGIRRLIIEHVDKGYPMSNFKTMLDDLSKYADKLSKEKLFKKIRKLIKNLYEKGILGRTAHEEMLELATVKVIKVLETEIKKLRKIALPIKVVSTLEQSQSILDITTKLKEEHDTIIQADKAVISAQFLNLHKILDLSPITPKIPILPCKFGRINSVGDATVLIKEAGYKIAFQDKVTKPPYWEKDGAPSLTVRDRWTKIGVSLWFKDGYISFSMSIARGNNVFDTLLNLNLESKFVNEEPAFYHAINDEGTICVQFSAISNTVMVYGIPADNKL